MKPLSQHKGHCKVNGRTFMTEDAWPGAQSREERSITGAPLLITGPGPGGFWFLMKVGWVELSG